MLRHGAAMLGHTFRGSSVRSLLGLESERAAFARYRAIRRVERDYVPEVDTDGDEQGSRISMIADRVNRRELTPH